VRPITQDRFRILDPKADRVAIEKLRRLACEVFVELNLNSLVRLDVRCDDHGVLNILEANPKPDLKRPTKDVTSLICGGLAETGMDYDDLILSLLADRLDFLLKSRRGTMGHIIDLLLDGGVARAPGERREPGAADRRHAAQAAAGRPVAALIDRIASDLKVQAPAGAHPSRSHPSRNSATGRRPEAGPAFDRRAASPRRGSPATARQIAHPPEIPIKGTFITPCINR
jgi:hypothetical protein